MGVQARIPGRAAGPDGMEARAARARERARRPRRLPARGRGRQNQAIWIEVYIDRVRTPGRYGGTIEIAPTAARRAPVELEVFDFTLPDENSMHAMVYYASDQPELYHGRNLDAAYHRFAHRHRVELVHAYDERRSRQVWGRFAGTDFTRERGLRGPGRRRRQHHRAAHVLRARHAISTSGRAPGRAATRG